MMIVVITRLMMVVMVKMVVTRVARLWRLFFIKQKIITLSETDVAA